MPDENSSQDDSTVSNDDAVTNSPDPTTGSGSSVMKLVGIGLGLTAIAALIVGFVFWKTLKDIESRDYGTVLYDPDYAPENDPTGAEGGPGTQEAGTETDSDEGPAPESSDDSPESEQ